MATQSVEVMIEGGKATAAPPLGPALGPLGVNIGQVVADINKKTESFKGMQVPVKLEVDEDTKEYSISVGTPPASALIKKEAGLEKGAANPLTDKVADLKIQQLIKIAKMKEDDLQTKNMKEKVKVIAGSCNSMGVLVEGKSGKEAIQEINNGAFAKEIEEEQTEISEEEMKALEEERKRLAAELAKKKTSYLANAKQIVDANSSKTRNQIKTKLVAAGIPAPIINEVLPEDKGTVAPTADKATTKK